MRGHRARVPDGHAVRRRLIQQNEHADSCMSSLHNSLADTCHSVPCCLHPHCATYTHMRTCQQHTCPHAHPSCATAILARSTVPASLNPHAHLDLQSHHASLEWLVEAAGLGWGQHCQVVPQADRQGGAVLTAGRLQHPARMHSADGGSAGGMQWGRLAPPAPAAGACQAGSARERPNSHGIMAALRAVFTQHRYRRTRLSWC